MTFAEAIELVKGWPEDRSVPSRLKAGIDTARGLDRALMSQLVEALVVASSAEADLASIRKHFG